MIEAIATGLLTIVIGTALLLYVISSKPKPPRY